MKVGIIGAGAISDIYLTNLTGMFHEIVDVKAVSDLNMEQAKEKAKKYGIMAYTTDEMLADHDLPVRHEH